MNINIKINNHSVLYFAVFPLNFYFICLNLIPLTIIPAYIHSGTDLIEIYNELLISFYSVPFSFLLYLFKFETAYIDSLEVNWL